MNITSIKYTAKVIENYKIITGTFLLRHASLFKRISINLLSMSIFEIVVY